MQIAHRFPDHDAQKVDYVNAGADLLVPRWVEVEVFADPDIDLNLVLGVTYDEHFERYVVDRIEARRKRAGLEVSSVSLRALRVQEYLQRGLAGLIAIGERDGEPMPFPIDAALRRQVVDAGPSDAFAMQWVARIYRYAEVLNLPPAKQVQEQLELKVPTASVWIRRARDRGFLHSETRIFTPGLMETDG